MVSVGVGTWRSTVRWALKVQPLIATTAMIVAISKGSFRAQLTGDAMHLIVGVGLAGVKLDGEL